MFEAVPAELKELNQWVCVRSDSKCPWMATELTPASASDYKTWSSFESAVSAVESGFYDNIGFVFADNNIVGIDIDCGFDPDGFVSITAADIIGTCRSYTELSRSGRGFHIYLKGSIPYKGKNNRNGLEIYKVGRYFIVTGDQLLFSKIREGQEEIDYVLKQYFHQQESRAQNSGKRNIDRVYHPLWKLNGRKLPMRPEYPEITPGCRNLSLTSLAGILRNAGYTRQQMYKELLRCNDSACKPRLGKDEVQQIVNSVMRYVT